MYKRILLAYDGTLEGRVALREGALMARKCRADIFLLSVVVSGLDVPYSTSVHPGAIPPEIDRAKSVLEEGVQRLLQLGYRPSYKLAAGDPIKEIAAYAKETNADLLVVAHRRQNVIERWLFGPSGAAMVEGCSCSMLIARNYISEEDFECESRLF